MSVNGWVIGRVLAPEFALGAAARAATTTVRGSGARCRTRPDRAAFGAPRKRGRALRPPCGSDTPQAIIGALHRPLVRVDEGGRATPAGPRPVGSTARLRHWRRTLSAAPGPTAARGGRSRPCARAPLDVP